MAGLNVPDARFVGSFRGEPGLEYIQIRIGSWVGVDSRRVAHELAQFEQKIQTLVSSLDEMLPPGRWPDDDQVAAIVDVCAWAHSEWVRIHPHANGNGRTARVWANSLAVRYGLPAFVRFRPRPGFGYVEASLDAMRGDWRPTAIVFRKFLGDFLKRDRD
jgi:fido (protein-threonine AMPylation protein)